MQDGALRAIAVLCGAPERHAARALLRDSGALQSIAQALGVCQDTITEDAVCFSDLGPFASQ